MGEEGPGFTGCGLQATGFRRLQYVDDSVTYQETLRLYEESQKLLTMPMTELNLNTRFCDCILRVDHTIADPDHPSAAIYPTPSVIQYR